MAYSHCIKKKPRTILPFSITIQDKQDEMLSSHISQDFFSSLLRTASLFWGKGVHTQYHKSHHKEQGIQITRYKHEHNSKTHKQQDNKTQDKTR